MTESELYKELGILPKDKNRWEESITYMPERGYYSEGSIVISKTRADLNAISIGEEVLRLAG